VVRTGPARASAPPNRFVAAADPASQQRIRVSFNADPPERREPPARSGGQTRPSRSPFVTVLVVIAVAVGSFLAGRASLGFWPRTAPPPLAPAAVGREALDRDDLITARATFAQLAAREPERADHHYWLGRTLVRQGELDEAVRQLERAIALDPDLSDAYVFLAAAYERSGKREMASQTLKKYAELGAR
jgi:cytochrome c-type biogenesis protein CcmH/NrfG